MSLKALESYTRSDWVQAAEKAVIEDAGRHFIDGAFVDSLDGAKLESINPSTNEPFATFASGTAQDIDRVFGTDPEGDRKCHEVQEVDLYL